VASVCSAFHSRLLDGSIVFVVLVTLMPTLRRSVLRKGVLWFLRNPEDQDWDVIKDMIQVCFLRICWVFDHMLTCFVLLSW
jgi:E3 ubiquitin-protein ligase DOA10